MPYRAVHTIANLHPSKGGPSRTVPNLCRALLDDGRWTPRILVAASADDVIFTGPDDPLRCHVESVSCPRMGSAIGALSRAAAGAGSTIVHDHGVWLANNVASALAARRRGLPLVISPRGMLEPWAMAHRSWKKWPAWHLYQRALVAGASLLHATSESEANSLRGLGLRQPIAIIPNGVTLPGDGGVRSPPASRQALFLSRFSVKKGVLEFLQAWERVRPSGWQLRMFGPDEYGYRDAVARRIAEMGLQGEVTVHPEVGDREKWSVYAGSTLFVLPSFSENFGVVVAEALGSGVPVITTTGTPWSGLADHECGWWVAPTVEAMAAALAHATSVPAADLRAMGQRGRQWVTEAFAWPHIGVSMADVYDWLLRGAHRADAPAALHFD